MDNSVIGSQIAKFRKAAGLTQEELSRAAGVSTQAVSRWECGGTPDVTLLPAIADRLGVTIDALFGREGGQVQDMEKTVSHWYQSLPKEQRYDKLNRLIWAAAKSPYDYFSAESYLAKCVEQTMGSLISSNIETDNGVYFGVNAEDMAFATVCPVPREGYKAFFTENEQYRKFFSILATPGCLEILLYMLGQNEQIASVDLLSNKTGIDKTQLEQILEAMKPFGLTRNIEVETMGGTLKGYGVYRNAAYVPFLYLARYLSEENKMNYYNISDYKKPLL